jgi:DNA polymerase-3 subunit beta
MRLTCNKTDLLNALTILAKVTPRRSPRKILQYVLLTVTDEGKATVCATDIEVYASIDLEPDDTQGSGQALIPVRDVIHLLKSASSSSVMIMAKEDKTGILVTCGSTSSKYPYESPDEFPPMKSFEAPQWCSRIGSERLRQMIKSVEYAADESASRWSLWSVQLEFEENMISATATDGCRVA